MAASTNLAAAATLSPPSCFQGERVVDRRLRAGRASWSGRQPQLQIVHCCEGSGSPQIREDPVKVCLKALRDCTLAAAVAASITFQGLNPALLPPAASAATVNPAIGDLSVLITGQPIKDARTLLRNALPIDSQPIKDIAQALERIPEDLKDPKTGYDRVPQEVRAAARALNTNQQTILKAIAPAKAKEGEELVDKLNGELNKFLDVAQKRDKAAILAQNRVTLNVVGDIEEAMVADFPYNIAAEYASKPWLKGRATVEMKVRIKNNANFPKPVVLTAVVDGYNAPITAGNFIDLVLRKFYDGMEIQRADGFVVQTGDPDGPSDGFVDPGTGALRTIPLEIKLVGDKTPVYGATLEELGLYRAQTRLPFNAFGTIAMAREEFNPDTGSSQFFLLLKESELTPSQANILDGRYAVFGYVVDNEDLLADFKVGDTIESIKVVQGADNLQNPTV